MKHRTSLMAAKSLVVILCLGLFSFSSGRGGDSFEIWLNGKMILQQFVHVSNGLQTLQLTSTSENDKLDIVYRHCGQMGTNRCITIKDQSDHALKVWKFADTDASHPAMSMKVKEILTLKKNKDSKLNVFYSSRELPQGRLLASLALSTENSIASK